MKTKVEIINETVAYYSEDVNRRSINEAGKCVYNGPDGKQCAFARVCQVPIPITNEGISAPKVLKDLGIDILKPEYQIDEPNFWQSLQSLHDESDYWDAKGLSKNGKYRVEQLLLQHQS